MADTPPETAYYKPNSGQPRDAMEGITVGQYSHLEKLGEGGMGTVYKATHDKLKRPVAIKFLRATHFLEPHLIARFQREMEAIGKIHHANIIQATDAGEINGLHFLVMEFVQGIDLGVLLARLGQIDAANACAIAVQAARGLQHAFELGLIHRDIKPANLLLSSEGEIKILDLGLARILGSEIGENLTQTYQILGTADYMAPEQASQAHNVDIRADIYSLGCTIYKLISGRAPFQNAHFDSVAKKLRAHAETPVPLLQELVPNISSNLAKTIYRMLAKLSEERFATPAEVVECLLPYTLGSNLRALYTLAQDSGRLSGDTETPPPSPTASTQSLKVAKAPKAGGPRKYARRFTALALASAVSMVAMIYFFPSLRPREARITPPSTPPRVQATPTVELSPDEKAMPKAIQNIKKKTPSEESRLPVAQLPRRVWLPLLDFQPEEVIWPKLTGKSRWLFDSQRKELLIDCEDVGLLKLGESPRIEPYTVEITLRQNRWTGGLGIFIGYHEEVHKNERRWKFQRIELRPYMENDDKRAFTLNRDRITVTLDKNQQPIFQNEGVCGRVVARPDLHDQLLQITVLDSALTSVRWAGQEIRELIEPEVNRAFSADEYRGEFGAYCYLSNGVFGSARWMIFERSKP